MEQKSLLGGPREHKGPSAARDYDTKKYCTMCILYFVTLVDDATGKTMLLCGNVTVDTFAGCSS